MATGYPRGTAQPRSHKHRRACVLAAGDIRLHRYVARGSRAGSATIHEFPACGGAPRDATSAALAEAVGDSGCTNLVLAPGSC